MGAVILAMFGEAIICLLVGWIIILGINILVIGAKLAKFVIGLIVLSPLIFFALLLFPFFLDAAVWVLFAFYHLMSWLWIAVVWCLKVLLWIVVVGVAASLVLGLLKKIKS